MKFDEMTVEELEARQAEIAGMETEGASTEDLDARSNELEAIKAELAMEITVTPTYFSAIISPAKIVVVSTAFEICLPIRVAKKKVYRPPMMGLTVVSNAPTNTFRTPVRSSKTSSASKITGA